eukprot:175753-Heterocapsa_arctica.AAC.1
MLFAPAAAPRLYDTALEIHRRLFQNLDLQGRRLERGGGLGGPGREGAREHTRRPLWGREGDVRELVVGDLERLELEVFQVVFGQSDDSLTLMSE